MRDHGRPAAAAPALDEALAGAHQLGNETLLLQALLAMGRAASRTGHTQEAESQLNAALTLAQKLQDRSRETEAILFIGDLPGMQGKWEVARGQYFQALQLAQAIPDPVREASALRGIAIAARMMGDPQRIGEVARTVPCSQPARSEIDWAK